MSTMERKILDSKNHRYPFTVPDGYFENLTARIMEQLPEEPQEEAKESTKLVNIQRGKQRRHWLGIISIAASFTLLAIVTLKFLPLSTSNTNTVELTAEYTDDDYNEDLLTYTMADHIDVYDYLSGDNDE